MPPKKKSYSDAELNAIVSRAVADALAAREPPQNSRRSSDTAETTPVIKPCSYKDFINCKPLNFKGTEGAIGLIRWIERIESVFSLCNCTEDTKVKFAAYTFQDTALTWWNTHANSVGVETANQLPWADLKKMLRDEYCPTEELHRLEEEFWHLTVRGNDIAGYTTKFQQLALLCPGLVDTTEKRIKKYIRGLPENIQGNVASSKPTTIQSAIRLAHELMAMIVSRETPASSSGNNKRKWSGNSNTQLPSKKPETIKAYTSSSDDRKNYKGDKPYCPKCQLHHDGSCPCSKCKRFGHFARDCRANTTNTKIGRAHV